MLAYLLSPKNKHNSMFVLALCSFCFYNDQTVNMHITNHKNAFFFLFLIFKKLILFTPLHSAYTRTTVLCLSG